MYKYLGTDEGNGIQQDEEQNHQRVQSPSLFGTLEQAQHQKQNQRYLSTIYLSNIYKHLGSPCPHIQLRHCALESEGDQEDGQEDEENTNGAQHAPPKADADRLYIKRRIVTSS